MTTKGFWERSFDAFCESYTPNQEEKETNPKAWTFALSVTLIIIGIITYFNFF